MASNILLKVIIHFNVAAAWPVEGCSSSFSDCLWTLKSYLCPPADSQQSTLYSRLRVKGMNAHLQIEQRRGDFIPVTSVRYEPAIWSAEITIPNKSCHLPLSHNEENSPNFVFLSSTVFIPSFVLQSWKISACMKKITSLPLAPFRKMNIFSQSKILQLDLTFVLMSLRLFGNSGMCTFLQCLVWGIRAIRRCDNSNMGDSEIILTMKWWFIWMWGLKKERERGLEGPHRIFKTRCKKRSQTHP